jgi:hypothetical protein
MNDEERCVDFMASWQDELDSEKGLRAKDGGSTTSKPRACDTRSSLILINYINQQFLYI